MDAGRDLASKVINTTLKLSVLHLGLFLLHI